MQNFLKKDSIAGDTIVLCTAISPAELEKLVNCEWLCSDGVIKIKAVELSDYSCVPPILDNFECSEIVWDQSIDSSKMVGVFIEMY